MNSLAQVLQRTPAVSASGVSASAEVEAHTFEQIAADLAAAPSPGIDDMVDAATYVAGCAGVTLGQDVLQLVSDHVVWQTRESRTFRLTLSPGTAAVSCHDQARSDRALERLRVDPVADHLALYVGEQGTLDLEDAKVTRSVTEWSGKSRARMFRTIPTLDLSEWSEDEGDLAMLTYTLPGLWEDVAPTGPAFKRLIELFRRRYVRAGMVWRGLWKLEFQTRGAAHLHALMRIPARVGDVVDADGRILEYGEPFQRWFARTWADVVDADNTWCYRCFGDVPEDREEAGYGYWTCPCDVPDTERRRHGAAGTGVDLSGSKYSDPRRIATYFLGHSSKHADGKEYQHIVPEAWQAPGAGPGRFWGYWGMKKGLVHVDLEQSEWYAVRRMLRKIAKARAWKQTADAARYGKTITRRRLRSLGHRGGNGGGTVVVNDGLSLAYDLGRALAILRAPGLEDRPMSAREARFRELSTARL